MSPSDDRDPATPAEPLAPHGDPLQPLVERDAAATAAPAIAVDADAEVRRLEREITTTRDALGRTIDAIGERLAPSAIVERATTTVKDAAYERLHGLERAARAAADRVRPFASGAQAQIRAYPLPAFLLAASFGWLLWASLAPRSTRARAPRVPYA